MEVLKEWVKTSNLQTKRFLSLVKNAEIFAYFENFNTYLRLIVSKEKIVMD